MLLRTAYSTNDATRREANGSNRYAVSDASLTNKRMNTDEVRPTERAVNNSVLSRLTTNPRQIPVRYRGIENKQVISEKTKAVNTS